VRITFPKLAKGADSRMYDEHYLEPLLLIIIQRRDSQVTMLGGVLFHATLSCIGLRVFFRTVQCGVCSQWIGWPNWYFVAAAHAAFR